MLHIDSSRYETRSRFCYINAVACSRRAIELFEAKLDSETENGREKDKDSEREGEREAIELLGAKVDSGMSVPTAWVVPTPVKSDSPLFWLSASLSLSPSLSLCVYVKLLHTDFREQLELTSVIDVDLDGADALKKLVAALEKKAADHGVPAAFAYMRYHILKSWRINTYVCVACVSYGAGNGGADA